MEPSPALLGRLRWSAFVAYHLAGQASFPFRPLSEIRRAQSRRVQRMVAHAWRTVPYYRETMARLGLQPANFRTAEDLARLPVIDRSELQRDPGRFLSNAIAPAQRIKLRSGGSTGEPISVWHDAGALFENAAHGERERSIWAGRLVPAWGYREAVVVPPFNAAIDVQEFCRRHALVPSSVGIRRRYIPMVDSPARTLEALDEFRPHVIHTYGSFIEMLFAHLDAAGATLPRPGVITYSSDGLGDAARRRITASHGIPIFCTYQAIEMFKIGFECEAHEGVHLNIDLYPLRLEEGSGEVIVSNLVNRATVLLNYRLGDVVSWLPGRCSCGRTLPRISLPQGRSDDFVRLTDGSAIHPQALRAIFTDEEQIWQYQVEQTAPARFDVRLVASRDCDRTQAQRRIVAKFDRVLGTRAAVSVAFLDRLERTPGGKLRVIRSFKPGR